MSNFKKKFASLNKTAGNPYPSLLEDQFQKAIHEAAAEIGFTEDLADIEEQIVNDLSYEYQINIHDVFEKVDKVIGKWQEETRENF